MHICEVAPQAEEESGLGNSNIEFKPQVTIPGTITVGGKQISFTKDKGIIVTGDTIAQYLGVFYRFFIALMAVGGGVVGRWGGFKRVMAAGCPGEIGNANGAIINALAGL